MSDKKILLLVDGNALFYRAYHAFPKELTTPKGEPINAVFGFARIFFGAIKTLKPTHVALAFDLKGPTFRHLQYDQYKATRSAMPEDLAVQSPRVQEIAKRLEAPVYTAETFEADDVIGTIARQMEASNPDIQVIILSSDQDLLQLVTSQTNVYSPGIAPRQPTLYTPEKVQEKYGFSPKQMIEFKSLRGDPSDNIPGVPGIGEVTAKQLISQFSSLEAIYTELKKGPLPNVKDGVQKKLVEGEESARLSHSLATIRTDVPITFKLDEAKLELTQPEHLVELFRELGFRSLIDELPGSHKLAATVQDVFSATSTENIPAAKEELDVSELSESEKTDIKLAPVLRAMEELGVKADVGYLKKLETEFDAEIKTITAELHKLAGEEFNPDSPAQVGHILYEVLKIPTTYVRKGKTGFTTDAATLQGLAKDYPFTALLLTYRELTKLQNTYVRPLQTMVDDNQRIHTSYAPDTATGRVSSRNPNLQNIPVRSDQGKRIRHAFIPEKGMVLVAADYSQMELRIAAHLSQDPGMIEAFKSGKDFHTETATRMNVDRHTAKMINFSILYGKGAYGFSQDLSISMDEAKQYIETYFKTYAKLREYLDEVLKQGRENGYVTTLFGRKRLLPDLTSSNYQHRSAAEREAVNMPIQGTQADMLKNAMCVLSEKLKKNKDIRLILTVHDELVLEVKESEVQLAAQLLKESMVDTVELLVPVEISVKSGKNWADLEPLTLT
jgi:DNA polymerase-1